MMAPPKLTLYVDMVSPFAYEAYYIIRHDPVFSACDITYVPVFLAGIIKACGNVPPITIKNKDKWVAKERLRWARLFNVPFHEDISDRDPPLTLTVMRAMCALTILHPGKEGQDVLMRALDDLFEACWMHRRKVQDQEVLAAILEEAFGRGETSKILEIARTRGKDLLIRNTDLALGDGAFGLPWFVAENEKGEREGFWGVDHLAQVTEFLGLETPRRGGWKALL